MARDQAPDSNARVAESLLYVHDVLARHGIWHALYAGSLLGAVRDGDVIPWDHDFDLLARPIDRQRIVELNDEVAADGYSFRYAFLPSSDLVLVPDGCERFNAAALVVFRGDEPMGDLYTPWLFTDGNLRQYDLMQEIYWCPRYALPYWFVEELGEAELCGRRLPAIRAPERWLEHNYGPDWRVPYRSTQRGGKPKAGMTPLGDRAAPDLADLVAFCEERGWDRSQYAQLGLPRWPRTVAGAGPGHPELPARGWEFEDLDDLVRRY